MRKPFNARRAIAAVYESITFHVRPQREPAAYFAGTCRSMERKHQTSSRLRAHVPNCHAQREHIFGFRGREFRPRRFSAKVRHPGRGGRFHTAHGCQRRCVPGVFQRGIPKLGTLRRNLLIRHGGCMRFRREGTFFRSGGHLLRGIAFGPLPQLIRHRRARRRRAWDPSWHSHVDNTKKRSSS